MCAFPSVRRLLLSYHVISILFLATSCQCAPAPRGATRPAPAPVNRRLPPSGRRRVPRERSVQVSKRARRVPRVRSRGWGGRVSARAPNRRSASRPKGGASLRAPDSLSHSRARAETPPTAARGPAWPPSDERAAVRKPTAMPPLAESRTPRGAPRGATRGARVPTSSSGRRTSRTLHAPRPRTASVGGSCSPTTIRVRSRRPNRAPRRLVARAGDNAPFAARRPSPTIGRAVAASAPTAARRDALDGARRRSVALGGAAPRRARRAPAPPPPLPPPPPRRARRAARASARRRHASRRTPGTGGAGPRPSLAQPPRGARRAAASRRRRP